jgi:hypothetical protein
MNLAADGEKSDAQLGLINSLFGLDHRLVGKYCP